MALAESCALRFTEGSHSFLSSAPMTIHWSWHHTPSELFSAVQRWHSCHASRYPLTLIFISQALQSPRTLCFAPQSLNEVSQQALGFCREDEVLPNALSCVEPQIPTSSISFSFSLGPHSPSYIEGSELWFLSIFIGMQGVSVGLS